MPDQTPRPMTGARATRGAVILLVLVMVLLSAFLMSRFIQRAGTELLADAHAADQERLRGEAYSALEVTLAVLADFRAVDGALYGPAQGWADPLRYAGYEPAGKKIVEITFEDESGKVSLPLADQPTLQFLLEEAGLAHREAERASDALLVWMRPDYTPVALENDVRNYERAELPHVPPQRALESWSELAGVEHAREYFYDESDQPNARWHWLVANASLFTFRGVNLNSAPPAALAVAGLTASQTVALKEHLQSSRGSGGDRYFHSAAEADSVVGVTGPPGRLTAEVQVLRIIVTVHDGAAVFRMSAVVAPPGGTAGVPTATKANPPAIMKPPIPRKKLDYPFRILEIQEAIAPALPPAEPVP